MVACVQFVLPQLRYSYPGGAAAGFCFLLVSSVSSASSGNTSQTYISAMPQPISTKLGHRNPAPAPICHTTSLGSKVT